MTALTYWAHLEESRWCLRAMALQPPALISSLIQTMTCAVRAVSSSCSNSVWCCLAQPWTFLDSFSWVHLQTTRTAITTTTTTTMDIHGYTVYKCLYCTGPSMCSHPLFGWCLLADEAEEQRHHDVRSTMFNAWPSMQLHTSENSGQPCRWFEEFQGEVEPTDLDVLRDLEWRNWMELDQIDMVWDTIGRFEMDIL